MTPAKSDGEQERPEENGMEVHPVISLLIARMESHPQQFYRYDPARMASTVPNNNKVATVFGQSIEHTKTLWNRKEKRLYNLALRNVRMAEAHERLMHALLQDK